MPKQEFQPGDIVEATGKVSAWPFEGTVGVYVRKARLGGHVIKTPHMGGVRHITMRKVRLVEADALPRARSYLARWGLVDEPS